MGFFENMQKHRTYRKKEIIWSDDDKKYTRGVEVIYHDWLEKWFPDKIYDIWRKYFPYVYYGNIQYIKDFSLIENFISELLETKIKLRSILVDNDPIDSHIYYTFMYDYLQIYNRRFYKHRPGPKIKDFETIYTKNWEYNDPTISGFYTDRLSLWYEHSKIREIWYKYFDLGDGNMGREDPIVLELFFSELFGYKISICAIEEGVKSNGYNYWYISYRNVEEE